MLSIERLFQMSGRVNIPTLSKYIDVDIGKHGNSGNSWPENGIRGVDPENGNWGRPLSSSIRRENRPLDNSRKLW